jgi:4-hydroxy-3-polyprenylbenzoate decarboxylase
MRIAIGITGASGAIYAQRLLERLYGGGHELHVTLSRYGELVWKDELGQSFKEWREGMDWSGGSGRTRMILHPCQDMFAEPSWGLQKFDGYLVVPCSAKTMSAIATGVTDNLISRFADVALKEKRLLVLLLRETPLHELHLERCLAVARAGAIVLPASPGFYLKPANLDDLVNFMVDKVLSYLPQAVSL